MKKKKNLNKKGFTMVELLAVILILGILATIAIPSVFKYLKKSSDTSFAMALKSAYEATENYLMSNDTSILIPVGSSTTIQINTLVTEGFLETIYDTDSNKAVCSNRSGSQVKVTRLANTSGELANYRYDVVIDCAGSGKRYYTYPSDELLEPTYLATEKYIKDNNLVIPRDVTLQTLTNNGYLKAADMKTASGSCVNANSKIVAAQNGNTTIYTVTLKCGSETLSAKFSI